MSGLALVVLLGACVLAAHVVADRFRIPSPFVLLAAGIVIGFIPQVRAGQIPPEVVLFLFLPVLLYWESLSTSLREIRLNLGVITLLSTALVIATAGAVAVVAHSFGLPWAAAWVLGAAVAPTDATAVSAFARGLPRRQVTVLQAESLVNDGTALVVYGLAVGIAVGDQTFTVAGTAGLLLLSYGGGILVGIAVAFVNAQLRRRLDSPVLGNLVMVLAPFTAYLAAEAIEASGVLAVVVSGLIMSQVAPRIIQATHRSQALAFWPLLTFIINGVLFVLVGVELQDAVRNLAPAAFGTGLAAIAAVTGVVVVARFAFLGIATAMARVAARFGHPWPSGLSGRSAVVSGLTGFRGAVSLAVALSVPITTSSGSGVPGRDLIVFITAGVILLTLVLQGALLPAVVRWARLPRDTEVEQEIHAASVSGLREALETLPGLAAAREADPRAVGWVRDEYETALASTEEHNRADVDSVAVQQREDYRELARELIAVRREVVVRLRDRGEIDDVVLRRMQISLDDEELRLIDRRAAD